MKVFYLNFLKEAQWILNVIVYILPLTLQRETESN